jgi:4-amino-4-deoxy-L-arabinose transferase-like glycosyltransferase
VPARRWVVFCLGLGVALRLAWVVAFPFDPFSDGATYWQLAQRLAAGQAYEINGSRSFWPPGTPLVYAPLVALFGPDRWIPPALNLVLFVGTAVVAWRLAERLADPRAGRIAMLIVAVWPNLIFLSNGVSKELVVAFLLPAACLLYDRAAGDAARTRLPPWACLAASGLCLGGAALCQPAMMLFGLVFLGYEWMTRAPLLGAFRRLAFVGAVATLTVAPWTVRNYLVHGEFIPINTAGGLVLYSANNDFATGGWIEDRYYIDTELLQATEIERDRLAYRKALDWIAEHKTGFVKLIVLRQTRFLCCDDAGAFLAFAHPRSSYINAELFGSTFVLSQTFWIALALLVIYAALRPHVRAFHAPTETSCLLALLYFLAVFGVYQSEGKAHTSVAVFLAMMASSALASAIRSHERHAPVVAQAPVC